METEKVFFESPEYLSDLLESGEQEAAKVLELLGSSEEYKSVRRELDNVLNLSYSNEDYKDVLLTLLDKIIQFLKSLAKSTSDGSLAMSITYERILMRVRRLFTETNVSSRHSKESSFAVKTRLQNLCVRYKPISDVQLLITSLKNLDNVSKTYFNYINNDILPAGNDIVTNIRSDKDLQEIVGKLERINPLNMANENSYFSDRGYRIESLHLMGNHQLTISNGRPDASGSDKLLGINVDLVTSEFDPLPLPEVINFEKFGITTQKTVLRLVESIATNLNKYTTISVRHNRQRNIDRLVTHITSIRNGVANTGIDSTQKELYDNYILLIEKYIDWLSSPYLGLLALSSRNLSATLNVCESNLG